MSTDNPAGDEGSPQTPFQLSYPDASHVTATEAAADVVLTADANRPAVRSTAGQGPAPVPRGDVGPLRRRRQRLPLRAEGPDRLPGLPADARETSATSAPGRRSRRTSPGCCATTRSPSSSSTRSSRSTPTRSSSRSSARTRAPTPSSAIDREAFDVAGRRRPAARRTSTSARRCSTGVQQMRSYRETRLRIGREGVKRRDGRRRARCWRRRSSVPDSWLRGFLQVQSAAALPRDHVPPRPDRPVQRPAPPAAARRPQGQAPRAAGRAGPRRAAAAGRSSRGRRCSTDDRARTGARRRGWSASGAAAGSC